MRTAILGWGSLVGMDDAHLKFLKDHVRGEAWLREGPVLPIEFARVSAQERLGALTLVIDREHGQPNQVWYIESDRSDPQDAACDLRVREGTVTTNVGLICKGKTQRETKGGDPETNKAVAEWAEAKKFDAVTWTDLRSNYKKETGRTFSVLEALRYLRQDLSEDGLAAAVEYEGLAPPELVTPLRTALRADAWWKALPR